MILSRLFVFSLLVSCVTGRERGALRGTHIDGGKTDDVSADSKDESNIEIMTGISVNVKEGTKRELMRTKPGPPLPRPVDYPEATPIQATKPILGIVRPKNGKKVNIWETFKVKVNAYDMYGSIPDPHVKWYVVDGYYRQVASGKVTSIRADIVGEGKDRLLSVQACNPASNQCSDFAYVSITVMGYHGNTAQQTNGGYGTQPYNGGQVAQPYGGQVMQPYNPNRHRGGNRDGDVFLP